MAQQAVQNGSRTYRVTLIKVAPYPMNWDSEAEIFTTEAEAMARAAELITKYPKNIARGAVDVRVESWAGVEQRHGWGVEVGRKIHLDTKSDRRQSKRQNKAR